MSINTTNHVNVTVTCDTCNKQARRKETIVNGNGTAVVVRFRSDLKINGWNLAIEGDECPDCFEIRLRKEGRI